MAEENGFDIEVSEKNDALPVPNEPFEGESFEETDDGADVDTDRYYEVFSKSKTKTMWWSVLSLIFGIASVGLTAFGWVALSLGVLAVLFSVISRVKLGYFDGKTVAGLMLGIFGIVFGTVTVLWSELVGNSIFDSLFGRGDGGSAGSDISDI